MSGDIADGNSEFSIFTRITDNKIIIIAPGFITINAATGDIQPFDLRIFMGQKVLLDFAGQIEGLLYHVMLQAQVSEAVG